MDIDVNWFAIIGSGIAAMVVGFLWYSPLLFAKPWMKLMGLTDKHIKEARSRMGAMYGLSFVGSLVMAYVLSHVITLSEAYFHYPRLSTGLISAFWMWLGFVAPVQMTEVLFGGKSWQLYLINTGYQLTSLLAMGIVIGLA